VNGKQQKPPPEAATGTVYLVGAGPGDPGLLTVRGKEVLYACDAIVYDRLAATVLPPDLADTVELHYVGKRADHHALPQDEINELLVRLAREGKDVCRLKGGDPFVFGRGGEEAEVLAAANIRFEVVPGVTAGIAAAAYAGIPVTHRGEAVRVSLVTAHEDPTKPGSQLDWRWLGSDADGTIAAYMAVGNLAEAAAELIEGGCDPQMPAAMIEHGTLPGQTTVVAPLCDLAAKVAEVGLKPPALFVVGRTVALRDKLHWFAEGSLRGKKVIVTRPADQARRLLDALAAMGVEPLICPTIRTEAAGPAELEALRDQLGAYDWLFFTSENGVRYFFAALDQLGLDVRSVARARFAAVGAGTADRLARYHIKADFIPTTYRAEAMLEAFCKQQTVVGQRILRIRGDRGPTTLEDGLRAHGAMVDTVLAYHIRPATIRPDILDTLRVEGADAITFTSGSAVESFERLVSDHDLHATVKAICIGPITADAAERLGWQQVIVADESSVAGLIDCVRRTLGG